MPLLAFSPNLTYGSVSGAPAVGVASARVGHAGIPVEVIAGTAHGESGNHGRLDTCTTK